MNVRKIGLRAGMAFLLTLLLFTAGCGRQAQEEESAPEKTVVTLWHYWDIPACQQTLSKLVKTFNASQDRITVEIKYVPDEDFKKQLALSMADGTMPDIAVVDSSDFRFFHNMKHFADLTGKLEVLPEYLPQAMEPCEIDGRVYGLPFGMNCPALIYNRQMLEEAGCAVPATWEEFCDTAVRTTNESHYGFAVAGIQSEESLYAFLPVLWSMGGDVTQIDSEAGRNAFSLLGTLSEQGVLNRQSVSMTLADVMHQFSKGKTAMMFNTCMTVGYIRKNAPDIEFGIAPIPSDGERITTVGGEIMAVSEDGHVEEALEFMRYLAEPRRMQSYMDDFGFLAPRDDVMEKQFPDDEERRAFVGLFQTARCREFAPWWPSVSGTVTEAMENVILGAGVEETLKEAEETITLLLEQGGGE